MAQNINSPEQKRRSGLFIFLLVLAIFLALNLALVIPYVLAILMGAMLTVFARPPYAYLRKKGLGSNLSALIVVFGILLLLIGPVSAFLSVSIKQAAVFGQWLSEKDVLTIDVLVQAAGKIGPVDSLFGGTAALEGQIRNTIQNAGKALTGDIFSAAGALPEIVLQVFLALITCFFLLLDGKAFLTWLSERVPMDREVKDVLSSSFKDTSISVVWSTLAAALVQALLMFIAFWALGVPGAFLAAGATFVFAWIPIVGSTPVWICGIIYLFIQDAYLKMALMLTAGLITGIADNFVRPVVLKGRSDMHPLVSLVAIFGGIKLFGILGVFVGPIFAGILISLLQIWPEIGRRFDMLEPANDPR